MQFSYLKNNGFKFIETKKNGGNKNSKRKKQLNKNFKRVFIQSRCTGRSEVPIDLINLSKCDKTPEAF